MKRFVQIEYWDYMDLKPHVDTTVFEGFDDEDLSKNVNDFVKHMQDTWCSGTTKLIGTLDYYAALGFVQEQITKEQNNWRDDSQEFIDKLHRLYKECYGYDVEEIQHELDLADDYASRE